MTSATYRHNLDTSTPIILDENCSLGICDVITTSNPGDSTEATEVLLAQMVVFVFDSSVPTGQPRIQIHHRQHPLVLRMHPVRTNNASETPQTIDPVPCVRHFDCL